MKLSKQFLMSENDTIKKQWEEIFQNISLEDMFRSIINERKYHGVYLRLKTSPDMYSLYEGEFAQDGKCLEDKKMLVSQRPL